MTFTRLQTVDADLVERIRAADPQAQRRAAYAAAVAAVQHTGLEDDNVNQAIARMPNDAPSSELRGSLSETVEDLDEKAWDLQEQAEQGTANHGAYLEAFAAARAAAAVLAALDEDPATAALEAAYEAQAATGDLTPIREATRQAFT